MDRLIDGHDYTTLLAGRNQGRTVWHIRTSLAIQVQDELKPTQCSAANRGRPCQMDILDVQKYFDG